MGIHHAFTVVPTSDDSAGTVKQALKSWLCLFLMHRSFGNDRIKTFAHFYYLGSNEKLRHGMTGTLVIG